jgi:hypothetical protein
LAPKSSQRRVAAEPGPGGFAAAFEGYPWSGLTSNARGGETMARPSIETARDWAPRPIRDRLPGRPSGPIDTVKAEIRHRRRQRRLRGARRRMTGQLSSGRAALRDRVPSPPSISMPSMPSPPSVAMPKAPTRRRRRKSRGLAGDLGMLVGAGVGYLLGTRAGRERYQQLLEQSRQLMERPQVQDAASKGRERVASGVDRAAAQASERLQRARERRAGTPGTPGATGVTGGPQR